MMANETETVAEAWEYVTYAPAGSRCSACTQPIKTLETVRRGSMKRASDAPAVIYRHTNNCPKATR